MELRLEELTQENYPLATQILRDDIPEAFVDTACTLMKLTAYGVAHGCKGHTFLAFWQDIPVGLVLLGEALPWDTDPPEMQTQPYYRLMGFVLDKRYRGRGLGQHLLHETIRRVYADFGARPIALGCHRENVQASNFYKKNGFRQTIYAAGDDIYFLRDATP